MIIGVPKEQKSSEGRVVLTPGGVYELTKNHIPVLMEEGAGEMSGFTDQEYRLSGAEIIQQAQDVFAQADVIVKVTAPNSAELLLLKKDHVLFCYLHLAVNPELAQSLQRIGCTVLAFETLCDQGQLSLLSPMSAIAGRVAVQYGSHLLHSNQAGKGVLLGGVPGADLGSVVVLGAGVAGWYAVQAAAQMGANITVFDKKPVALTKFSQFDSQVTALFAEEEAIAEALKKADLVIGCILETGCRAEMIVPEDLVKKMPQGSVIVDLAINQGGCIETSKLTEFDQPTYQCHGVTHMCVPNLPGIVPKTASQVLSGSLVPYLVQLAQADIATHRVFQTALVESW